MGLPLNVICLNAAMSVYARSGRWYESLALLAKMRDGVLLTEVGVQNNNHHNQQQGQRRRRRREEPRDAGVGGVGAGGKSGTGMGTATATGTGAGVSPRLALPRPNTITYNAAISGESYIYVFASAGWGDLAWAGEEGR